MTGNPISTLLSSYKKPKVIGVVSEFALISTGKIAKKVLREQPESEAKA